MDGLFELIAMLVWHWRLWITTLGALIIAIFLAATLSGFTGWYGILLVLLGFGIGLMWEGAPRSPENQIKGK